MKPEPFIEAVQKLFTFSNYDKIYDLCAGKGELSAVISQQHPGVTSVDWRAPNKSKSTHDSTQDGYRLH